MASRFGSALSSCSPNRSEEVEIITSDEDLTESDDQMNPSESRAAVAVTGNDQAQGSFLWRLSSGAIGGVYNVASSAAGMSYNTTKWVLGKGVEAGSSAVTVSRDMSGSVISKTAEVGTAIVGKLPVPSRLRGKDKKE